jgi:hypothetical protein
MKLTLRKTWHNQPMGDNDFEVVLDGKKSLARILARRESDFQEVWQWSIFGFNHPGINGQCLTLDEAKAETKKEILRLIETNTPLMPEPPEWQPGTIYRN